MKQEYDVIGIGGGHAGCEAAAAAAPCADAHEFLVFAARRGSEAI